MAKEIIREYVLDDLVMLERAQVFHDNFLIDKAVFVLSFPLLDDPFAANMQTAIDEADAIPSGAQVDSQIAVVTAQLNAAMEEGRKAMQVLFTYANVTWNSAEKTNTFGKNRYNASRASQLKLQELMEMAHEEANITANKTALAASGYTQAKLDNLMAKHDAIHDLNRTQEQMKSQRGEKTRLRIIALNNVWGFMKQINQASKVVFADNEAKLDQYMLYPTASTSLPKPQGILATIDGIDLANVTWDTVPEAESYKVYYSEVNLGEPSGEFAEIAEVTDTSFQSPLVPNKRNYWKVKAFSDTLSSAYSDEVFLDGMV